MDALEFILKWGWLIIAVIYLIVKLIQKGQVGNAQQPFAGFPPEIQPYIDKSLNTLFYGEKTMQAINIIVDGNFAKEEPFVLSVLTDHKMYCTFEICSDGRIIKNGEVLCYWDNAAYRKPNGGKIMYTFTNNGLHVFCMNPEEGIFITKNHETYITEMSDIYHMIGCDELDLIKQGKVSAKKTPSKSSKAGKKKTTKDSR